MTPANEMQVGGDHYKAGGVFQHWDYVAETGMNYFQGNASKYVTRAYKKNGRQDLLKAQHYIQKAIELQQAGLIGEVNIEHSEKRLKEFAAANGLTDVQTLALRLIINGQWYEAGAAVNAIFNELPE